MKSNDLASAQIESQIKGFRAAAFDRAARMTPNRLIIFLIKLGASQTGLPVEKIVAKFGVGEGCLGTPRTSHD